MPDRLDELLDGLPSDPMPADLPARLQLRLARERHRQRRARMVTDSVMVTLVLWGGLVLIPRATAAGSVLTPATLDGLVTWIGRFGSAPAPVVWDTLGGLASWSRRLAEDFGVTGLLGLALLAIPLCAWLKRLMPESEREAVAGAEPIAPVLDEGAIA
jgi:hypothetical protein